jgi:hypothetical protein
MRLHKLRRRERKAMQIGIATDLRNLGVRCNKIARAGPSARDALTAISEELADKAAALETRSKLRRSSVDPCSAGGRFPENSKREIMLRGIPVRSGRIELALLRVRPFPPMSRAHVQPFPGFHFHPTAGDAPAREHERMQAIIIDDG